MQHFIRAGFIWTAGTTFLTLVFQGRGFLVALLSSAVWFGWRVRTSDISPAARYLGGGSLIFLHVIFYWWCLWPMRFNFGLLTMALPLFLGVLCIGILGLREVFKKPFHWAHGWRLAILLFVIMAMPALRAWAVWVDSDAYLANAFSHHKADYTELVRMIKEDNVSRVTVGNGSGMFFRVKDPPIQDQRRLLYESIGRRAGIRAIWLKNETGYGAVTLIFDSTRLATTENNRGYLWSPIDLPKSVAGLAISHIFSD